MEILLVVVLLAIGLPAIGIIETSEKRKLKKEANKKLLEDEYNQKLLNSARSFSGCRYSGAQGETLSIDEIRNLLQAELTRRGIS